MNSSKRGEAAHRLERARAQLRVGCTIWQVQKVVTMVYDSLEGGKRHVIFFFFGSNIVMLSPTRSTRNPLVRLQCLSEGIAKRNQPVCREEG